MKTYAQAPAPADSSHAGGSGAQPPTAISAAAQPEMPQSRLRIAAELASARALYRPAPEYPGGVRKTKATVELTLVVGRDGRVKEAHATTGDPVVRARAIATAQDWRFQPYIVNGETVEFETTAQMEFVPAISNPHALATSAYQAGYQAFVRGDYEDALKAFQHVVQYEPKFPEGWNEIGRIHLVKEEFEQAVQAFEKELQVSPGDLYARNNLGLARWLQKQYPEALASYREQLRRHPGDQTAQASVGLILEEQKEYAAAAAELEKAIAAAPSNTTARIALANCYCQLKREQDCMSAIHSAVTREDTAGNWQGVAAAMAARSLRPEEAQKYATRAVRTFEMLVAETNAQQVSHKNLQDMHALAMAWQTLGRIYMLRHEADALRYLRTAWLFQPDSNFMTQLLQELGREDEAKRYPRVSANEGTAVDPEKEKDSTGGDGSPLLVWATSNTRVAGIAPAGGTQAEFYWFTRENDKAAEVHWIAGDERLRALASALQGVKDPAQRSDFPGQVLLRRLEVTCMRAGEECSVRFLGSGEALQRAEASAAK